MTDDMPQQLRNTRAQHGLSGTERSNMKQEFMSFMAYHPAHPRTPAPARSVWVLLRYGAAVPVMLFALLVYASESALPSEPLYTVKRSVTERALTSSSSLTPSTEAWVHVELVERRLDEIGHLIQEDKLEPETVRVLSESIEQHTDAVEQYLSHIDTPRQAARAQEVARELETVLGAHGDIIEALSDTSGASTTVAELLEDIAEREESINIAGDLLTETLIKNADSQPEHIDDVKEDLERSLEAFADEQTETSDVPPGLRARAEQLHQEAQELYISGAEHLGNEDTDASFASFSEALEHTEEARLIISADVFE